MVTWSRTMVAGLGVWVLLALAWSGPSARAEAPAGARLTGSVVDAALAPIPKAAVTLEQGGHVVVTVTTDAAGAFVIPDLAAGDYDVRVEVAGTTVAVKALHVASDAKTLTLPIVAVAPAEGQSPSPAARDPWQVVTIAPGVVLNGVNTGGSASGQQVTVNGFGSSGQVQWNTEGGIADMSGKAVAAGRGGGGGVNAMPMLPPPAAIGSSGAAQARQMPDWTYDQYNWPPAPGETYAPIEANGFQPARERPLSTFGADVDTASYTNIRRFLSAGQLPPSDAVRIEELVNYFHFSYPEPRDGRPLSLTTEIGDCPWAPSHRLVLIGARAAASRDREVTGRNIVLLIDVSGSMQPAERLPLIKTAFGMFVDTLRADDTVSIVTYAGTSGVALWPTPARQRDVIQNAIARLSAGGSTNGGEGLIAAYRIARQAFVPGGVNRVILATDGDFNVGLTSQNDLLQLIERERDSGVFLSVFGVGTGNLKDRTMELLADHGNGHYAYLDSLQEARRLLIREADATLETVAKDVKFQVEFNPAAVGAWKLLGYEKREMAARDFNNDRKDGGELGAGHTVTVLYEVVPVGASYGDEPGARPEVDPLKYQPTSVPMIERGDLRPASPNGEWLTVKARFKAPEGDVSDVISLTSRPGARGQALPMAAAVAEFGLLLRDGPFPAARWDALLRRIDALQVPSSLASDRDSFRELAATAAGLARLR